MSNAPERIWAEPDGGNIIIHNGASNLAALIATGYLTEYIRADLMAELVEALRWYGEVGRLARLITREGDAGRAAISADGGQRAAAALANYRKANH